MPQTVGRLTAGGSPLTTERPTFDPFGIALGADGAYWVAEFAAGDLLRITADGAVSTLPGLPKNDPREITAGPGNTLWVSLEQSKKVAKITGVDPPAPPVVTPPVVVPAADTTAPVISVLKLTPTRLRAGTGRLAPLAPSAKAPATITLTLSEAATVTFAAERVAIGVRRGTACAAPRRGHPPTRRTSCTRYLPVKGTRDLALPAGASRVGFAGRLAAKLAPGAYRLTLAARDAAGNVGTAAHARFAILAPKRRR